MARGARVDLYSFTKRLLDIAVGVLALVVLSPLFGLIALAIVLDSGLPILYRQVRVGRDGRPFTMFKFRSMRPGSDPQPHIEYVRGLLRGETSANGSFYKVTRDDRITRLGRLLRRTSADELPQLWNVLRGEMSLVGPRPDVTYSVAEYAPWAHKRLRVKPGITGLWQVSGRASLSLEDMLRLDVAYVERRSFWLDLEILVRTVPAVITARGAV